MPVPSVDQVERLLGARFGRPVRVASMERVTPWAVLRCALDGQPASVIVKWLRDDPNGFRVDPRQLSTEQAALEFLETISFAPVPRPIAADRVAGIVVMEDMAPRTPLDSLLRRDGLAPWTDALCDLARLMGELGAATVGREAAYDAIRAQHGSVDPLLGRARGLGHMWTDTAPVLDGLGLTMTAAVEGELAAVADALLDPGPFLVFTNGDPHPNNFLVGGDGGGRLIDFEAAAYRHAMTSVAWIHVPGPAWMTVADPASAEIEASFRLALSTGVAEAQDDRLFGFGMAAACLAEARDRLGRFATLDARKPGDKSRAQMVSTLESAANAAREHRSLLHLAGWVERAAGWLRRRWPDANIDLASIAAYTPRH